MSKSAFVAFLAAFALVASASIPDVLNASASSPAFLSTWPAPSHALAASMIDKYGQPDQFTQGELVWLRRPPFKKIVVYRFPTAQGGSLAETVDYFFGSSFQEGQTHAPRLDLHGAIVEPDVAAFQMTAIGADESSDVLALNAANDVMRGRKSPTQAREEYAQNEMLLLSGKSSPASERLTFQPSRPSNSDWDQVIESREGGG